MELRQHISEIAQELELIWFHNHADGKPDIYTAVSDLETALNELRKVNERYKNEH